MQYKMQNAREEGSFKDDVNEIADFLKGSTKGGASSEEIKKAQRDMQIQHESEMQSMQQTLMKVQKELSYKDEDVRNYKQLASEATEKFEKVDKNLKHLQTTISDKDQENDRLELKFKEFEVRIGKLNTEKQELVQEKLDIQAKFDDKDAEI